MINPPYYNCNQRSPTCHSSCPVYLHWKAERDERRAEREKEYKTNDAYFSFKRDAIKRVVRGRNSGNKKG